MWAGIVVAMKLVFAILSFFMEKNSEKKKRKRAGIDKVLKGIEDEDPSSITAGFDNINNA
jgi:hypothetical protein